MKAKVPATPAKSSKAPKEPPLQAKSSPTQPVLNPVIQLAEVESLVERLKAEFREQDRKRAEKRSQRATATTAQPKLPRKPVR